MRGSCQHQACLPPTSLTASRPAEYDSGSKCGHKEDRRLAYWILTRISHFALNKSGIGISVLYNRCFISTTSQFGWVGGGKGIGTIFQKITLSICGLWPVQSTPTSHIGVEIMLRLWKYIVGHISFKMRYHIGVYVNYGAFCSYFSNITPKI